MAPTPEEQGVADRGLESRGVAPRGSRPDGYEEFYTVRQVFAKEPVVQATMRLYSTKDLVERARAKHAFLVGFSEELEGTAAEVARAQSHLATTLLAMKDEMDRRVENPGEGNFLRENNPIGEPISLLDHMDPFMHYRTWQSYILPDPKPRRRKRRKRRQPRWRTPVPDFSAPFRTGRPGLGPTPRGYDRPALHRAADLELERTKKIIDDLMKEQTEIYNKISFVLDGTTLSIDLAGVAGVAIVGIEVLGVGLAAASVLLGVATSMGQGVQASAAAAQKNGMRMGVRHLYQQVEALNGRPGRLSAKQAYDSILEKDLAYPGVRVTYSLSEARFQEFFQKGILEAATVMTKLMAIADRVAEEQLSNPERGYSQEEIRRLLPKARYASRAAIYRALKRKLKWR